jgi:hypothetical protein
LRATDPPVVGEKACVGELFEGMTDVLVESVSGFNPLGGSVDGAGENLALPPPKPKERRSSENRRRVWSS